MNTLEGHGISISFKKRRVVNNISIHVNSGEIIGLLGPNGAGKTTTFHMILGIHKPDSGNIFLNFAKVVCDELKRLSFLFSISPCIALLSIIVSANP